MNINNSKKLQSLTKIKDIEILYEPGMYLTYSASLYFKECGKIEEVSIPHHEIAESIGEFVLKSELIEKYSEIIESLVEEKQELGSITFIRLKEKYQKSMEAYWRM